VHIITHSRITAAQVEHPDSATALDYWYRLAKRETYRNFAGLKAVFGSVDKVGPLFVFDVGGNKLRIIAAVHFNTDKDFILYVLTHRDYERGAWKRSEGI